MGRSLVLLCLWQALVLGSFVDRNVLLQKRAASDCTSSPYTTPSGLDFAMSCNSNIAGNDWEFPTKLLAEDVYDCMRKCSTHTRKCYGVSYNFNDAHCYLKNSSAVGKTPSGNDQVTHSALVTPTTQLTALDSKCGFTDLAIVNTNNGMPFKVSCGKGINKGSDCPPSANSTCRPHATSLQDCMNQCSAFHPLCTGVSFQPGMENGYVNCQFKFNFDRDGLILNPQYTTHSAIFQIQNYTSNCTDNGKATAVNNHVYGLQCNQNRPGNDLTVYHEVSLQKCIDNCATYENGKCVAVIFDENMELGFENCYLKSSAGTPNYNSTAVFALATGTKDTASSTPSSSPTTPSSGSGSKAWIAGVVVGVVVALVLVTGFIVWKKRRATHARPAEMGHEMGQEQGYSADPKVMPDGSYVPMPAYSDNSMAKTRDYTATPPVELADTQPASELPAQGSGK